MIKTYLNKSHQLQLLYTMQLLYLQSSRWWFQLLIYFCNYLYIILAYNIHLPWQQYNWVFYDLCIMIPPPSAGPGSQRVFGSGTLCFCSHRDWSHCWTLRSLEGSFAPLLYTPALSESVMKRLITGNACNNNKNAVSSDASQTSTIAIHRIIYLWRMCVGCRLSESSEAEVWFF